MFTHGIDYFDTFSPMARLNSIRLIFSIAINLDKELHQMDIKNVFLYGDFDTIVYMEQPSYCVAQGKYVCKLNKAIYGLKQSPRA